MFTQETAGFVRFTEEILNEKFHLLGSYNDIRTESELSCEA